MVAGFADSAMVVLPGIEGVFHGTVRMHWKRLHGTLHS
jgi:hypothetical protein